MAHRARGRYAASVLILSLFASAAAYAAAEDITAEKPAQTAPEDKSYLPPSMRAQPVNPAPGSPVKEGVQAQTAQATQTAEASDAKRARGAGHGQSHRRRQHVWPGGFFFGGGGDFFGR